MNCVFAIFVIVAESPVSNTILPKGDVIFVPTEIVPVYVAESAVTSSYTKSPVTFRLPKTVALPVTFRVPISALSIVA